MKRCKGEVVDFKFRDKNKGWGLNALIIWRDINAKEHSKSIPHGASSYYDMFLKSEIYRENCYSCPYAGEKREGDFTLGDYWGVQKEHPELMKDNGGVYNETKGVSCILVNTNKGKQLFQEIEHLLQCDLSTFEKVANGNLQLQKPSTLTLSREKIFDVYQEGGYAAVEKYFQKRNGMRTYYFYLKNMLPQSWKKTIKKIIKKG